MANDETRKLKYRKVANVLIISGLVLVIIPMGFWLNEWYYQWSQAKSWKPIVESSLDDSVRALRHPGEDRKASLNRPEQQREMREEAAPADKDVAASAAALVDRHAVKSGESIAFIEIPTLKIEFSVLEDASWTNLSKGPVRVSKTARIGDKGTVLISGHRTMYGAPFHNLHLLKLSDEIILYTKKALFIYTVTGIKRVKPDDWGDIKPDGEPQLVLSTCEPMYSAEKRLLVIAGLTDARKVRTASNQEK